MDMSGLKRNLNETYADDDSEEYILNHQEFDKASKYINTEENKSVIENRRRSSSAAPFVRMGPKNR